MSKAKRILYKEALERGIRSESLVRQALDELVSGGQNINSLATDMGSRQA